MKYLNVFSILLLLLSCNNHENTQKVVANSKSVFYIPYIEFPTNNRDSVELCDSNTSLSNLTTGIVSNCKLAVILGYVYFTHAFGDHSIREEFPLRVSQDSTSWIVSGTLTKGYLGGVPVIYINKTSGKVERLYHTK
ncbi:MAG: NTF2 fold immunity protein [Bacteroidetes bacterium]|nr:NTF2 fold immunity protein [Bacteroidota bacterium]